MSQVRFLPGAPARERSAFACAVPVPMSVPVPLQSRRRCRHPELMAFSLGWTRSLGAVVCLACACADKTGGTDGANTEGVTSSDVTSSHGGTTSTSSGGNGETMPTPDRCIDATSRDPCIAASDQGQTCGWMDGSTFTLDPMGACIPAEGGQGGACYVTEQVDDCGDFGNTTCPGQDREVYFHRLDSGAVELVAFDLPARCLSPYLPFEPCDYVEGDPESFDPPECACGCL
jgi:hypothetical protein